PVRHASGGDSAFE
ncbi:FAD binding domain protein, partial [Vibrio parahaemolyticus AQ3810]